MKIPLLILILSLAASASAQEMSRLKCVEGLPSTEADYKRWLERDAAYIITDAERKAFLGLKTNEDREQFIENFWLRRDPTPETDDNKFRDEYYTRIAYANEHFASGLPGWKTDRGRVYIQWGPPDRLESGVTLDMDNNSVPYEKWYYRDASGMGDTILPKPGVLRPQEVVFVDPTMSDEFRIPVKEDRKRYPYI